jgi:hypothetical protein
MSAELVTARTPLEFFRDQLERAMQHQRVSTSAFTEYYLVNLLASSLRGELLPRAEPGFDETPLALLYARALSANRGERARLLRALGDTTLFVAGFFADSLSGRLADFAYYRALGGRAYGRLSHEEERGPGGAVFGELAGRFTQFADLLAEISENSRLAGANASVLQIYERWLQTGSPRAARLLAERGLAPVAAEAREQ